MSARSEDCLGLKDVELQITRAQPMPQCCQSLQIPPMSHDLLSTLEPCAEIRSHRSRWWPSAVWYKTVTVHQDTARQVLAFLNVGAAQRSVEPLPLPVLKVRTAFQVVNVMCIKRSALRIGLH